MRGRNYEFPQSFIDQYERAIDIQGVDGNFDIAAMEALIADSVRTGSLDEAIDWRRFVDMSFLQTAFEELGMDARIRDCS